MVGIFGCCLILVRRLIEDPFGDMYIHKTPQNPSQNTPFPGLNLKFGKMNYRLGNLDPNWANCLKSGQNFSIKVGKKKWPLHVHKDLLNMHCTGHFFPGPAVQCFKLEFVQTELSTEQQSITHSNLFSM